MKRKLSLFIFVLLIVVHTVTVASEPVILVEQKEMGLAVTDKDVEQEIRYLLKKNPTLAVPRIDIIKRMAGELLTNKILLKQAVEMGLENDEDTAFAIDRERGRILAKARLEKINADELSDGDLENLGREYWHVHADEFAVEEKRALSHILINTASRTEDEAEKIAVKIYQELSDDSSKFESLVKEYSDDKGSRAKKGSLGLATKDRFVPEFSKSAFGLKLKGTISEPVKTKFGYHIIRLDAISEARQPSFEEVKAVAIDKAKRDYIKSSRHLHITQIQSEDKRSFNQSEFKNFHSRLLGGEE